MNPSIHGPASRRVLVLPLVNDPATVTSGDGYRAAIDFLEARGIPIEVAGAKGEGSSVPLTELEPGRYGAVLMLAGPGLPDDLGEDSAPVDATRKIVSAGGLVAADGHGIAALLGIEGSDGEPLLAGRRVTCGEEDSSLQGDLAAAGATVDRGPTGEPWVISDGNLLTAQNDASMEGLGEALAQALIQMVPASRTH